MFWYSVETESILGKLKYSYFFENSVDMRVISTQVIWARYLETLN